MKDLQTGAAARPNRPLEPGKARSPAPAVIGLVCVMALALWAGRAMTENGNNSERAPATPRATVSPAAAQLARAIERNDEAARRPRSGREQDRLRKEKSRLRDAQTAHRC